MTPTQSIASFSKLYKRATQTVVLKDGVLPGGLASRAGKTPGDMNQKALRKGMSTEEEHSKNKALQKAISTDHLVEDPKYYEKNAAGPHVFVGKKSKLTKEDYARILKQFQKNTGIELSDLKLQSHKFQPLRNLFRYFVPTKFNKIPEKLRNIIGIPIMYPDFLMGLFAGNIDAYFPTHNIVSTKGKHPLTVAHEIGHWIDYEKGKGAYPRSYWRRQMLWPAKGKFYSPTLTSEINASLMARKGLGDKAYKKDRQHLETALATYLLALRANHVPRTLVEVLKGVPKAKATKHWKPDLRKALKSGDKDEVRRALRNAYVSVAKNKHVMHMPLDTKGPTYKWTDKSLKYPLLAHELLEEEYKNWQTAEKIKKKADFNPMTEPLQPQQQRIVNRIMQPDQPGLVVAHGTGSGKTRASIEAYKKLNLPTNVIVPAALVNNYEKELKKWVGYRPDNVNIDTQQMIARSGLQHDQPGGLQIVDESQHARERTSRLNAALKKSKAKKKLLLSGTPIFNTPIDLANQVNLVASKQLLPSDKKEFEQRYVDYKQINPGFFAKLMGVKPGLQPQLKNTGELKNILNKYVDYYQSPREGYPSVKQETISSPMGQKQYDIYKTILGQAPWWTRYKVKHGLPPGKGELEKMRAFLTGLRQVSNSNADFVKDPSAVESVKIQRAADFLRRQVSSNPRYKAVVYSNYINSGLKPYEKMLQQYHIPYGEFSGEMHKRERQQMVNDYNANKLRALLISSAGSEGLDLKGTRLVQLLEPHFNTAKEDQIIGRGARFHSHDALPPNEQNLLVQRYLAQPPQSWFGRFTGGEARGTDEYIRNLALNKAKLTDEIINILKQQNEQ